jgi:hypothetical protein
MFREHASTAARTNRNTKNGPARVIRIGTQLLIPITTPNKNGETIATKLYVFRDLPNDSDDVDDAIAAISAPPFDVPTTRMGTAGGFLRFGGGGGDRR